MFSETAPQLLSFLRDASSSTLGMASGAQWALIATSFVLARSFVLLCLRAYAERALFSSWVEYNPRRAESDVRRVTFKHMQNSKNVLSGDRRFELFWFSYSLAMPAYEKSVATLDTFADKFVLKQEFEHSRVHAKLNDSYEDALPAGCATLKVIKGIKQFWRSYFSTVMVSPVKDIMILGEIALGFNCLNVENRLQLMKHAPMSDDMRQVIVYHDLEEIEHGLDLVPKISECSFIWRLVLATVYSVHDTFFGLAIDAQVLALQFMYKPAKALRRSVPHLLQYVVDPLGRVNMRIWYAVMMNRYPSRADRDEKEALYVKRAVELHDMDLNQHQVLI